MKEKTKKRLKIIGLAGIIVVLFFIVILLVPYIRMIGGVFW